ncbi:BON domain-containing protein [Patescibacteria group bacterium]|nr:MAG: BON domain-containing protein [Patescibacteria group bacterium]
MNKIPLLLFIPLLINGCTTMGVGTAEVTGIALFHDRRNAQSILTDEKIENDAMITLNLDSDIRSNSHFNVTSYNGIVLITGETPIQALLSHISETIQALNDVRLIQNQMLLAYPSSFSTRANDSLITAKIKIAFTSDPRLPGFDTTRIKVVTENSRVFLMGLVYPKEGDIAAEIARQQPEVQEVIKVFEYI